MPNDETKQETPALTPPSDAEPRVNLDAEAPAAQKPKEPSKPKAPKKPKSDAPKKADEDLVYSSTAKASAPKKKTVVEKNKNQKPDTGKDKPKREKVDLEPTRSTRPAHRVIPYILVGIAAFLFVCLLLNLFCNTDNRCADDPSSHLMGSVGYWICYGLFGLLGASAFALPLLILNMALYWRTYIDNKLVLEKTLVSLALIVFLSTTVHVFAMTALTPAEREIARGFEYLFEQNGVRMYGGGLVGGSIAYFLVSHLNIFGGIIVSIFLTLLSAFFFLGKTPQFILERIRTKRNLKAPKEKKEKAKKEKEKKKKELDILDEDEPVREAMKKKHDRASGKKQDDKNEQKVDLAPIGAVEYDSAPKKKKKSPEDKLAPIAMPVLDASDDSTEDNPLYLPDEMKPHSTKPAAKVKPNVTMPKSVQRPASSSSVTAPAVAPTARQAERPMARPAATGTATGTPVTNRPSVAPSIRAQQSDALDSVFPRTGTDAKTAAKRVQKTDRNFELENIFVNKQETEAPQVRRHAPLPPEVPMPGSPVRKSAPAKPASPTAQKPTATASPAARPAVAQKPTSTAPSASPGAKTAKSSAPKPVFRQADKSTQEDYGLSAEEFEKREAASQTIRNAAARKPAESATAKAPAKSAAKAAPSTAKATTADKPAEKKEATKPYVFPPISYLHPPVPMTEEDQAQISDNMTKLSETLGNFRVNINEITYSCGPTVTRYEIFPAAGVRVRTITSLADDIALAFATQSVRMEALPGKSAIGVEVPNTTRSTVYLRELIESKGFADNQGKLMAGLGADVTGRSLIFDISKMPHLLVAGATGMGKSVCINCIIMSILFKARPDEVKLILVDPKKVEFSLYKGIPHLMAPIIVTPKDAAGALQAAVNEMEDRFNKIQDVGVRDIAGYNRVAEKDPDLAPMPHVVIIIDELADLMLTARDEVEDSICRLAQKARAAGMHIIVGTQRPSVDVVTGLIKSNIPSRIACTVASQVDSRTILDSAGAEKLLGKGDMLFAPVGAMKPTRVQGAFVSDAEIEKICEFIRVTNGTAQYDENFTSKMKEFSAQCGNKKNKGGDDDLATVGTSGDNKYLNAIRIAIEENRVSTSLLQRKLGIGYSRAAKIIDRMEEEGLVSKADGSKPRSILISAEQFIERYVEGDGAGTDVE